MNEKPELSPEVLMAIRLRATYNVLKSEPHPITIKILLDAADALDEAAEIRAQRDLWRHMYGELTEQIEKQIDRLGESLMGKRQS